MYEKRTVCLICQGDNRLKKKGFGSLVKSWFIS